MALQGLGGIYASRALARVLYGEVAPAGLLPYTIYPESWADCKSKTQCSNPFTDMSLTAGDGKYNNTTVTFFLFPSSSVARAYVKRVKVSR